MSQNNSNDKAAGMALIEKINVVEGFDPTPFAVDFTDLNTQETRKRLPVVIQMAWFHMKYPEGKIATTVKAEKECFVATARIYPSYKDGPDAYLAEATASRGYHPEKPSVSPREWAQTAAIGIALRNAGFGLQFAMAGEEMEGIAANEFGQDSTISLPSSGNVPKKTEVTTVSPEEPVVVELTPEQKLEVAMKQPCPIAKYNGKTLGDMVTQDPKSLIWLATKYSGSAEISAAAKLICDHALQASA